jgi:hypothetical protein
MLSMANYVTTAWRSPSLCPDGPGSNRLRNSIDSPDQTTISNVRERSTKSTWTSNIEVVFKRKNDGVLRKTSVQENTLDTVS